MEEIVLLISVVRGIFLIALKRIRNETEFWERSIYNSCNYPPFQTYLSKIYPDTYVLLNFEKRNVLYRSSRFENEGKHRRF